ncbi:MAG: hypothetical protein NE334_19050 [Lentisphaeraceae bacterium]|nr:hypothetical protein [Lentisphaeraceae bacterium]
MKYLLAFLFSFSLVQAGVIDEYSRNKKVVVVIGKDAPEVEKEIGRKIFNALELDKTGDLYDHIIEDDYAIKHKFFYSSFHLIVVGTLKSNKLCAALSDIQKADFGAKKSNLEALNKLNPLKDDYFFARYGLYKKVSGTGFIRRLLNPFALEAYNLSEGKAKTGPMTATYISGADIDGISNAYVQFLDSNLLEGVVLPSITETQSGRFHLSPKATEFPSSLNSSFSLKSGDRQLKQVGWIQGALVDYSGIYNIAKVKPLSITHLKFKSGTPTLMTFGENSNSIMAIEFNSATESLGALKAFDRELKLALKIEDTDDLRSYRCFQVEARWLMIRKGKWLVIESLPMGWKDILAQNAAQLFLD